MEIVLDNPSVYWVLRIFLLCAMVFCGYGISYKNNGNKYFWYYAIVIIAAYTLIEGLRYNRGVDYAHYAAELQRDIYAGDGLSREPLYDFIVLFFRSTGIPFYFGFMLYSFMLISSLMLVLKKMPAYAFVALPIFYALTWDSAETFIRQFIAIAFVLYALYFYLNGQRKLMYAMLICVPLSHLSGLIAVGPFLLFVYMKPEKWIKTPAYFLAIYVISYLVWDLAIFDQISDLIQQFDIGDKSSTNMDYYVQHSDEWFSTDSSLSDKNASQSNKNIVISIAQFISNCMVIWFGYYAMLKDKKLGIVYYFSFIGILLMQIAGDLELWLRFGWWFIYLVPIMIAGIIANIHFSFVWRWPVYFIFALAYFGYLLLSVGSPGYSGSAFVWDIVKL